MLGLIRLQIRYMPMKYLTMGMHIMSPMICNFFYFLLWICHLQHFCIDFVWLFDFKLGPLEGIVIRMQDSEYELRQAGSKKIEIQRILELSSTYGAWYLDAGVVLKCKYDTYEWWMIWYIWITKIYTLRLAQYRRYVCISCYCEMFSHAHRD